MVRDTLRIGIFQRQIPEYRIRLFNYLIRNISDVVIEIYSGDAPRDKLECPNYILPNIDLFKNFWITPGLIKKINHYDIVVLQNDIHWISLFSLVFMKSDLKVILWGQGISNKNNPLGLIIRRIIAEKADAIMFYDNVRKDIFCNSESLISKSFVVPNTLVIEESEDFSKIKEKEIILCIGRLNGFKRTLDVVQAYNLLELPIKAKYDLVIIGDGEKKNEISEYVSKHRLEANVILVGPIYSEEILVSYFKRALCSVIPGTVGLGVVHAFAYGVPLIASINRKHGPEFNYCNQDNTFFYDGSIQDLARVLTEVCIVPDTALKKGRNAYNYYMSELNPINWVNGFIDTLYQLQKS